MLHENEQKLYIYIMGPSPGSTNWSPTKLGGTPDRTSRAADRSPCSPARDRGARQCWPACPRWPRTLGPSHAPIESTQIRSSRLTPHAHDPAWLSHFHCLLNHFDKASTIFSFQSVIFATLLLECSTIFATVLSHFRELSHSSLL
jgi:hypothetical protein